MFVPTLKLLDKIPFELLELVDKNVKHHYVISAQEESQLEVKLSDYLTKHYI